MDSVIFITQRVYFLFKECLVHFNFCFRNYLILPLNKHDAETSDLDLRFMFNFPIT